VLALLLLASLPAPAQSPAPASSAPLALRWDLPVRYHAEASIQTPDGYRYIAWVNTEAVAKQSDISLDLSCTGQAAGRGWEVMCTIDDASLSGVAYTGDQADLDAIFQEHSARLMDATVQIQVTADGHLGTVDLEGIDKRDDRMAEIFEDLRQLVRHDLAPLDLSMPRGGEIPHKGAWRQKGTPLLFQLLDPYGTAGGSILRHQVGERSGAMVRIDSWGHGNMSSELNLQSPVRDIVNMVGGGSGRFDSAKGQVAWRKLSVEGDLTAGSAQYGNIHVYGYQGYVARINADGTREGPAGPQGAL